MAGSANDMKWWEVAQLVTALIGLVSVLIAIYTFFWQWKVRAVTFDRNRICADKHAMGYFVANSWRGNLFWRTTQLPLIPTVRGVIEAGDDLLWTSSVIESMRWSDGEVSWLSLYQGVFNEIVWKPESDTEYERRSSALAPIIKQAQRHKEAVQISQGFLAEMSQRERCCVKNLYARVKGRLRSVTDRTADEEAVDHDNDEEDGRDECSRHLLYVIPPNQAPTLLDCVRPLDQYGKPNSNIGVSPLPRRLRNLCRLWILGQRPCIEIRREELAALMLIFGITLKCRSSPTRSRLIGDGAFGVYLRGNLNGPDYMITLKRGRRLRELYGSKGSGYTTMHAKWLGAGAIPWGNLEPGYIRMIWMTEEVVNGISEGQSVIDSWPDHEWSPQLHFLVSLQDVSGRNIDGHLGVTHGIQHGHLLGCFLKRDGSKPIHEERARWERAVASIAFGGLVPQTSPEVQRAVAFTVSGRTGEQGEAGSLYNQLEILANSIDTQMPNDNLFGKFVTWRRTSLGNDPETILNKPAHPSPATAAATFGRYMTMLEFFAAKSYRQQEKEKTLGMHREEIFEESAKLIGRCYSDAVKRAGGYCETKLGDEVVTLRQNLVLGNIGKHDCACLVRCILAAWAGQVFRIRIFERRDQLGRKKEDTHGCSYTFLEDLPMVAALG